VRSWDVHVPAAEAGFAAVRNVWTFQTYLRGKSEDTTYRRWVMASAKATATEEADPFAALRDDKQEIQEKTAHRGSDAPFC